ncbi:leucine-rich repeat extensin-like protein 6 [Tasmannia lanceolata]|uniref:leucine-rich repeat extensin-like protein 6 n=1 Tax=Tasmannia lanceolata TaxID=3420 RepID=UPI004062B683
MRNPYFNLALWAFFVLFLSQPSHQAYPPLFNPRLQQAFIALQAWKLLITSDPNNLTSNWYGPNVCSYNGVFCAPAPDNPNTIVVAGIDLNHGNITGSLPEELGLLTDLALFHINSNSFCGTIPKSFHNLHLLLELDLSNNLFSGRFPPVLLSLPSLKYLDIRFNQFEGAVPDALFDLNLDAIFINNNGFRFTLPENIGNSPVSVLVLANNKLNGCLPPSLEKMAGTLNEVILLNTGITGCVPPEIGSLNKVTVFDVSSNKLVGPLPDTIGDMTSLEQLNVADNRLSGVIPASICELPNLDNFTFSYNYFCGEPAQCLSLPAEDDRKNCIPGRPVQRSKIECASFLSQPINCNVFGCSPVILPPLMPPWPEILPPWPEILPPLLPSTPEILPPLLPSTPEILPPLLPSTPEILPPLLPSTPEMLPSPLAPPPFHY